MNPSLHDVATAETLLVVSDFDGTLAGIVPDPSAVPVHRGGLGALARLAGLPGTTVAILSGRGREDLRRVCPLRAPVVLAGSHGAESGE
ncbi:trehalose-phosphatase, partial [Acinetobacter baumannii]|nr:trehalose-phosphatase [Acinetobacter baumannii]